VAICTDCNKVLPLSKYERHNKFYCLKKPAECPMCFEKFPMSVMQDHMAVCDLKVVDPDIVTCKYCKSRMRKEELMDHAIAHLVHQKQVEWQIVERVADVEDFFEEESLEMAGERGIAPLLDKEQLQELPVSTWRAKKNKKKAKAETEKNEGHSEQPPEVDQKCTIC